MDLSNKTVREICSCAEYRNLKRGEAVFCTEAKGKNPPGCIQFMNIKSGEVCTATEFFSTGHADMDSYVDEVAMKKCPSNPNYRSI
jgi:hypothetical protein